MATIMDNTREFTECPWCHAPARLFSQMYEKNYNSVVKYYVGCPNKNCHIKPHTKAYSNIDMNKAAAMNMAITDWEAR